MKLNPALTLSLLLSFGGAQAAEPKVIPLWPDGVPDAITDNGKESGGGRWVRNVHVPTLTIYPAPKDKATGTGVVICPGGGYGGLAIDHEGRQIAAWLNQNGIAGFILKYRHAPYKHPVPMNDVQRALRIVRSGAKKFGVQPDRIGIIGFSAGGHLASTAVTHFAKADPKAKDAVERVGSRPDFGILMYPVISMKPGVTHGGSRRNLLGNDPDPKLEKLMSNELQVTKQTPPTFLVHAIDDSVVILKNSELFLAACKKAGVPSELLVTKDGAHGFGLGRKGKDCGRWPARCIAWLGEQGLLEQQAAVEKPRQTKESYEPADGSQGYRYLLHLPQGAKNSDKKWPLLVFLHGRGERGDDLSRVKAHGPPKLAEKKDMDFIVASPQCPKTDPGWKPKIVVGMIDEVSAKHPVDKTRIYLTGLSMGGFGTWATAAKYPKKFAAIAPVCGGGKVEWAKKYGKLPIWNFHGDKDFVVPPRLSRIMVQAIKKAGGNVKYTEYPGVGHNSWNKAYDDPKLYEWFLSHKR